MQQFQRLLTFLLASLFFISVFGCIQTDVQEKTGAGQISAKNYTEENLGIDEDDLPIIEDVPLTQEDAIPQIEDY